MPDDMGGPAAMRCVNQHSIRFGTLNGDKVLEITGNYNAAYSGRKLDANQRAGLTLRAVLLPILTMAVAQFRNDPDRACCHAWRETYSRELYRAPEA